MAHYYDSSALVFLVVDGRRSAAMWQFWSRHAVPVASLVARTELMRAVRRVSPGQEEPARRLLASIEVLALPPAILDAAARLDPVSLRSLDAIHLATALDLGDDLESFVTYDDRLAAAARGCGLVVVRPE